MIIPLQSVEPGISKIISICTEAVVMSQRKVHEYMLSDIIFQLVNELKLM